MTLRNIANRLLTLLMAMVMFGAFTFDAEARRMGGGKSFGRQSANVTQRQATPVRPTIPALSARHYRYGLTGDTPPWRPVSVFDDGRRVYIQFPRGIVQGEMPPLFVIGSDGEAQIVNSRIYQNILIVDRIFAAAELRLGSGREQQMVRIVRTDGRHGS